MRRMLGRTAVLLGLAGTGPATAEIVEEYRPVAGTVQEALALCLLDARTGDEDEACEAEADRLCLESGPAGDSTFGMAMCAQVQLGFWDGELNRLWPGVLEAMRGVSEDAGAAMLAEQRAWIAYRDATCLRVLEQYAGGTMQAVVGGTCRAGLTADRVILFRDLLDLYGGGRAG